MNDLKGNTSIYRILMHELNLTETQAEEVLRELTED